jgi:hypothetical protein
VRRSLLVLLAGIALQGLAAVAVIAWWTGREPASEPVAAAAEGALGETAAAFREPAEPPARRDRPAEAGPAPDRKVPSVVETTPAPRRRALRSFRQEMKVGLAALRQRVAECAAPGVSLTLEVETYPGGVRVVDAHLDPGSSRSDPAVVCARATLLGETFPAANAEPGRRWQMPFLVGKAM